MHALYDFGYCNVYYQLEITSLALENDSSHVCADGVYHMRFLDSIHAMRIATNRWTCLSKRLYIQTSEQGSWGSIEDV